MNQDDQCILKLKGAGIADNIIAEKMGMTQNELHRRFRMIWDEINQKQNNGYAMLIDHFSILAHQYQLVGESLKVIGTALDQDASHEEVKHCFVDGDADQTVKNIMKDYIVLKRFTPPNPEKDSGLSPDLNFGKS